MKLAVVAVATALVTVVVLGCSTSPVAPSARASSAAVSSAGGGSATAGVTSAARSQQADVIDVAHGGIVAGSARLLRNTNGISVEVRTTGLVSNEVYSLWWVIYPPGCPDPLGCIVTNASGTITDGQGRAHFGAHLSIGPVPPADGSVTLVGGDFENPLDSEVLLVIHHHGPKIPTLVGRMLSTFDVGCANGCLDDPQIVDFPANP
jgi:hypothetical protein